MQTSTQGSSMDFKTRQAERVIFAVTVSVSKQTKNTKWNKTVGIDSFVAHFWTLQLQQVLEYRCVPLGYCLHLWSDVGLNTLPGPLSTKYVHTLDIK